jgi:hypothetical protein
VQRVAIALLVFVACSKSVDVDRESCTRLRDHVVDLRFAGIEHATDPKGHRVDVSGHRAALKAALGEHFIDSCIEKMSPEQLACALDARDLVSEESCTSH